MVLPHRALVPHSALKASRLLVPHNALLSQRALLPIKHFGAPTNKLVPDRALLPQRALVPQSVELFCTK